MASTFHPIFLFLFVSYLSFTSSLVYARFTHLSKSVASSKQQVERLIKSLNSFPKDGSSVIQTDSSVVNVSRLVEQKFKFPSLPSSPNVEYLGSFAGYYPLPNTNGARMFYFFFESRNKKSEDPVVIWLSGGPGSSCSVTLFYESGPFRITDEVSLVWNDYGWDKVSNILYIDQPIGTGFSYTTSESDLRDNHISVSNDLYNFLQEFFKAHMQFAQNDFFIVGQSYGGHTAPTLASLIHQRNQENVGIRINLRGFAIGNGFTNPKIQYPALLDYAKNESLIKNYEHRRMTPMAEDCVSYITACVGFLNIESPHMGSRCATLPRTIKHQYDIVEHPFELTYRTMCRISALKMWDFNTMDDGSDDYELSVWNLSLKEEAFMKDEKFRSSSQSCVYPFLSIIESSNLSSSVIPHRLNIKGNIGKEALICFRPDYRYELCWVWEDEVVRADTGGKDACRTAFHYCMEFFHEILHCAGDINYYDIRKNRVGSKCYDYSNLENFYSKESVKDALNVRGDIPFVSFSSDVYSALKGDLMKNLDVGIPALLEDGIRVLIYAGDQDLLCNWLGNSRWVDAMKWSGDVDFRRAQNVSFFVGDSEAGELRSHKGLSFLKVFQAGHMVAKDQPKVALRMIQSWMHGRLVSHLD
ncbi:serine carboxypeptidase 3-like [Tripterygium wilfordii]|uniref:serine carboxypeptidase 3-like n=1 Tax=Tripterygium wilfordii TaxID=458696 RepID=UPI0018F824D9|nr:serine carboxypeptidase 3-like [Tripterygium wilfordii]